MWMKLTLVPTVIVSVALTFAPVFAQDTQDRDVAPRTTTAVSDDDDGPEYGWLGLLGLVGLGGLLRRDRDRDIHTHTDRGTHRQA
jgi:MYXO-CTERM domain-containing protein